MGTIGKTFVSVQAKINSPLEKVWKSWISPEDIIKWNYALDTWHTPYAENDLRVGGKFNYRMEAKDGSFGFDFWGIYDKIVLKKQIEYTLGDGRKVNVVFSSHKKTTDIVETFETESENPVDMQRNGWQAILNNFKKHIESDNKNISE